MSTKYKAPKFPRILVSSARHAKLAAEALKKKVSIAQLVEGKLVKAR